MEKIIYDTAIIGTGPAGLSAAINLKLHNKSIAWFGARALSDKIEKSEKIANYPGFGMVSGTDLNRKMALHADDMGLEITEKTVISVIKNENRFMVLAENEIYETRTVLLATGIVTAKGLPGEKELLGRGVSYCATCDGFLYKGKTVAVFCSSPKYEHEVEYLAEIAEKVWLYTPYRECGIELPNVERLEKRIAGIKGDKKVQCIELSDGTGISVDGIFILRNAVALSSLMPGLETDNAHIVVDRMLATSCPGCFAAGDCTGRPYQIAKAAGEGNVAAHSILEYLSKTDD